MVLKGPFLPVVRDPQHRPSDQLGRVGEERGRQRHFLRPLGSVTVPMGPFVREGFLLPKGTWERVAVVKGPLLPQCGQLEKALEARDLERLELELRSVGPREGRCIL